MNKKILLLLTLLAVTLGSHAAEVKPYEWEVNRKRISLTTEDRALSEIILKQHVQYNYVFDIHVNSIHIHIYEIKVCQ